MCNLSLLDLLNISQLSYLSQTCPWKPVRKHRANIPDSFPSKCIPKEILLEYFSLFLSRQRALLIQSSNSHHTSTHATLWFHSMRAAANVDKLISFPSTRGVAHIRVYIENSASGLNMLTIWDQDPKAASYRVKRVERHTRFRGVSLRRETDEEKSSKL